MADSVSTILDKASHLSADECLRLIHELWDRIPEDDLPGLSKSQRAELDRLHALMKEDPDRTIPYQESLSDAKAAVARIREQRRVRDEA